MWTLLGCLFLLQVSARPTTVTSPAQLQTQADHGQPPSTPSGQGTTNSLLTQTPVGLSDCPQKCHCYAITIVDCSRANLTDLLTGNLRSNQTIAERNGFTPKQLHLGFNNISTIPDNAFLIGGRSLENLYLQNNAIAVVRPNAFRGMMKLKYLDVSHNLVSTLIHIITSSVNSTISCRNQSVFAPLRDSLLSLQLSYNQISAIPDESFVKFRRLEVLSLSNNQINWIGRHAFADLHNLKTLVLRANPLGPITVQNIGSILSYFSTGIAAPLNDAKAQKFCSSIFLNVSVNENDKLNVLDLGETNLRAIPPLLPVSLRILMLDGNKITEIAPSAFRNTPDLQVLYLANNQIRILPDGVFRTSYQLHLLDMSRNKLENLTANVFCGLTNLQILRLYKNPTLRSIPPKIFSGTIRLSALYLHDCGIRDLPMGPWIHRLVGLWLYGNPLDCSCTTLVPILSELRYPGNKALRLDPYRDHVWDDVETWPHQRPSHTQCSSPSHLTGLFVKDISLYRMSCSVQEWDLATRYKRLAIAKDPTYKDPDDYDDSYYYTKVDSTMSNQYDTGMDDYPVQAAPNPVAISLEDHENLATSNQRNKSSFWVIEVPLSENADLTNLRESNDYNFPGESEGAYSGDLPAAVDFENDVALLLDEEDALVYRKKSQETDLTNEWLAYYEHVIPDDNIRDIATDFGTYEDDYEFVQTGRKVNIF